MERRSSKTTRRSRVRRSSIKVPCDNCIQRASIQGGADIKLCERCTAFIHRPRRRHDLAEAARSRTGSCNSQEGPSSYTTPDIIPPGDEAAVISQASWFFVEQTLPLVGVHFDTQLWQRLVLRVGKSEYAVKQAAFKLESLHRTTTTPTCNIPQTANGSALMQVEGCSQSILRLIEPSSGSNTASIKLLLTATVLLSCLEAIQGNDEQAAAYAAQAQSMLYQHSLDPSYLAPHIQMSSPIEELDPLELLVRRCKLSSTGELDTRYEMLIGRPDPPKQTLFVTLDDARQSIAPVSQQLHQLFHDLDTNEQLCDVVVTVTDREQAFGPWLQAWEQTFASFLAANQALMNPTQRREAMVLKAQHLVSEILANVDLSLGSCCWNAYSDKFAAIVDLGTSVRRGGDPGLALGVEDILCVIARCGDPVLRRKASNLLPQHVRDGRDQSDAWASVKYRRYSLGKRELLPRALLEGLERLESNRYNALLNPCLFGWTLLHASGGLPPTRASYAAFDSSSRDRDNRDPAVDRGEHHDHGTGADWPHFEGRETMGGFC